MPDTKIKIQVTETIYYVHAFPRENIIALLNGDGYNLEFDQLTDQELVDFIAREHPVALDHILQLHGHTDRPSPWRVDIL